MENESVKELVDATLKEFEEMTPWEMKHTLGGSGGNGGSGSGGYGPCCRCNATAYFCDGGGEVNGTDEIENGLFCGSNGQSCEDIMDSWVKFQEKIGMYCNYYPPVIHYCTQISW